MDDDQQFCLRWNNHQSTLISVFDTLLENGTLVDCTLAAEGKFLKAHKVVLSACSPYFATLLSQQYDKHPIFILKDVKFQELRAMMDYMYRGEVNISQDQLAALLKAAESLQIKGLSDSRGGGSNNSTNAPSQAHKSDAKSHVPAPPKASGLTIENKRPLLRTDFEADISGSREGSVSPSTRKRKKVNQRRKSLIEANNLLDNHDQHSNSSSHSNNQQLSTSATSAPTNNLSVTNTKKTDQDGNNQEHDHGDDENAQPQKRSKHDDTDNKQESELMLEPKNEYDDDDDDENDDNVEDLTMDDEMLEDLEAGPSHGGEGSSQGYHWQNQEGQESSGQHRDAQGNKSYRFKLKEQTKSQQPQTTHDMNDCLLESENFQITKADNNKYLLLPVKKPPAEKIVLKECELVPVKRPQIKVTTKVEKSANISIVQKVPLEIPQSQQISTTPTATTIATAAALVEGEKKVVKTNHPRIKYSRHKNPTILASYSQAQVQVQPQIQQQATVQPIRTQVLSDGKKIEYISVTTVQPAEPIAKPIIIPAANNTQQFVIQAVPTSANQQVTEYEVSAAPANTSSQSSDFHNEIMDDLEYGIDDIELPEDVQIHFSDSYKDENDTRETVGNSIKKYYATVSDNSIASDNEEAGRQYECRHCGKKYRWKSTLRRHENVECGGKEASHQCPYCSYKAKQRGNLGVHIRKHHADKPPLETRRTKKTLHTR